MAAKQSLMVLSGIEAGEAAIGAHIVADNLRKTAMRVRAITSDRVVTTDEMVMLDQVANYLEKQAQAADEAASLGASASNRAHKAERAIRRGLAVALYGEPEDRADNILVMADFRINESGVSVEPDSAA